MIDLAGCTKHATILSTQRNANLDEPDGPMSSWFGHSLIAFFLMGIQGFLYKVAAERRCDTARTTFVFMSTVAILSFALWIYLGESVGNLTALIIWPW